MQADRSFIKSKGFSLVEFLVVLVVLGLVFVGSMKGFNAFKQVSYLTESEDKLATIKENLLVFSENNYFLPCPDTDNDGRENRTRPPASAEVATATVADGFVQRCTGDFGTVPYLDIGMTQTDVEDGWSNPVYYFVNQNVDQADLICDKNSAASYFCNEHAGQIARFTAVDTPPLVTNVAASWNNYANGDYTVCNENVANCTNAVTLAANQQSNVAELSASVVLVAYNEDGANAISNLSGAGVCTYANPAAQENCDEDLFFHDVVKTDAGNAIFDDVIVTISGYEIKARALGNQLSWQTDVTTTLNIITPTAQTFDLDDSTAIPVSDTATPDVITVARDITDGIDLQGGDDYLTVGNDINAGSDVVDAGDGNDTVFVSGDVLSDVVLGAGNDKFLVEGKLDAAVTAGGGDDRIWVVENIESGASLDLGTGDDVLWFGGDIPAPNGGTATPSTNPQPEILADIDGGDGYDIIVFEDVSDFASLSTSEFNKLQNFELIYFADDGSGNRNYYEIP